MVNKKYYYNPDYVVFGKIQLIVDIYNWFCLLMITVYSIYIG